MELENKLIWWQLHWVSCNIKNMRAILIAFLWVLRASLQKSLIYSKPLKQQKGALLLMSINHFSNHFKETLNNCTFSLQKTRRRFDPWSLPTMAAWTLRVFLTASLYFLFECDFCAKKNLYSYIFSRLKLVSRAARYSACCVVWGSFGSDKHSMLMCLPPITTWSCLCRLL